jgi:flagellar protein FlaG
MNINSTVINIERTNPRFEIPSKPKNSEPTPIENDVIDKVLEKSKVKESQEDEKSSKEMTKENAQEIADNVNKMVRLVSGKLEFSVHQDTDRVVIRVIDSATKEVIREIPPENVLKANAKYRDMLHLIGFMMDEKV